MLLRFNIFHLIVCDLRTRIIIFCFVSVFLFHYTLMVVKLIHSLFLLLRSPYFLLKIYCNFIRFSFFICLFFSILHSFNYGCIQTHKEMLISCCFWLYMTIYIYIYRMFYYLTFFLFPLCEGFFFILFCHPRIISFLYHHTILHLLDMS